MPRSRAADAAPGHQDSHQWIACLSGRARREDREGQQRRTGPGSQSGGASRPQPLRAAATPSDDPRLPASASGRRDGRSASPCAPPASVAGGYRTSSPPGQRRAPLRKRAGRATSPSRCTARADLEIALGWQSALVGPLPGKALVLAPEVTVEGGRAVDRAAQVEHLVDAARREVEVLAHDVLERRRSRASRCRRCRRGSRRARPHRSRRRAAPRSAEAAPGLHQVLRHVARGVGRTAVDLRRDPCPRRRRRRGAPCRRRCRR